MKKVRLSLNAVSENKPMPNPALEEILTQIRLLAVSAKSPAELQQSTVDLIAQRLPTYNWVGFYMLDPHDLNTLVLGPFHGAPTQHTRIPVSQGICGAAVAQAQTVIVDDVSADPRYLSCSIETKSEIVVPIYAGKKIIGEIDIDSHQRNAFTEDDRRFLESAAEILGPRLSATQS
jgi:GAF domain-containing protein